MLAGMMAVVAMNLMACVPGLGCAADDPETNFNVAPLTFEAVTTTQTCDAVDGVVLDLATAQGSSIRIAVQKDARVGVSLPLTADVLPSSNVVTSATADNTTRVTLTDAEYNELPSNWQSAAVTLNSAPVKAGASLSGDLHFYFADGRTLDVTFNHTLTTTCASSQSN